MRLSGVANEVCNVKRGYWKGTNYTETAVRGTQAYWKQTPYLLPGDISRSVVTALFQVATSAGLPSQPGNAGG